MLHATLVGFVAGLLTLEQAHEGTKPVSKHCPIAEQGCPLSAQVMQMTSALCAELLACCCRAKLHCCKDREARSTPEGPSATGLDAAHRCEAAREETSRGGGRGGGGEGDESGDGGGCARSSLATPAAGTDINTAIT